MSKRLSWLAVLAAAFTLGSGCDGRIAPAADDQSSALSTLTAGAGIVSAAAPTPGNAKVPRGGTMRVAQTFTNKDVVTITFQTLGLTARGPGRAHSQWQAGDNFNSMLGQTTLAPGDSVKVTVSRPVGNADALGSWTVYGTWEDASGAWHDGPEATVTVVDEGQSTDAGTPTQPTDAGTPTAPADAGTPPGNPLTGAPYVEGTLLRHPDGSRFYVKGVAMYAMPFYPGDWGGVGYAYQLSWANHDGIFAQMEGLGINTVRIPLAESTYDDDYYGLGGKAGYLSKLQTYVASAKAHHLNVLFGWWDSLGAQGNWPSQYTNTFPMMKDVVQTFANDPTVMFEPWNEPNNVSWAQWNTVMQATVRYYRSTLGYKGVLYLDTINWSWDFDPAQADSLLALDKSLLGRSNVMFANHRYANQNAHFTGGEQTSWEGAVGKYVGTYPLVGTEYGFYNSDGPPQPAWNSELFTYLAQTKVPQGFNGAWLFVWNWVDSNKMTNEDVSNWSTYQATFPLSPNGVIGVNDFYNLVP